MQLMAAVEVIMGGMEVMRGMVGAVTMAAVIIVIGIIMQGDTAGMVGMAITGEVLTTMVDGGGVEPVYF